MRRLAAVLTFALAIVIGLNPGPSVAYPGADGYDKGYCYAALGLKMGLSNWKSGTGQVIAVDVDDNSKANIDRVTFKSSLGSFVVTRGLARVEIYRANPKEIPTMTLWSSNGSSCYRELDGSMQP